ncbi:MAG: GNAT family N-acetyltransferase [Bacteroidia bacterium]
MKTFLTPARLENDIALILPLDKKYFHELSKVGADPDLWVLNPRRMQGPEDMADYLEDALMEQEKGISIPFVIIDKRSGEVAGSTRYANLYPVHKRLEIGWTWIGKKFQQTGLNRAVKFELLRYGFETLDLNRIELKTDIMNIPSRTAMKKLGATEEGVLRGHTRMASGRYRDTVYYSILKSEWPDIKKTVFASFL